MGSVIQFYFQHPYYLVAVSALLGLYIGSFLGVVASRVPQGRSIIRPPSACDHCDQRLRGVELLAPVIGYVIRRGRCRHCQEPIPAVYPVIEAVTAVSFAIIAWNSAGIGELLTGLLLVSILVVITVTDLQQRIIPDRVLLAGLALIIGIRLFHMPLPWWDYALASLLGGGILYMLAWLSLVILRKQGMGGGDIKCFALLGLFLGLSGTLLTLFLASCIGLLGGIWQRIRLLRSRKTSSAEDMIPFGPSIALAAVPTYLWGESIIKAYLSLF